MKLFFIYKYGQRYIIKYIVTARGNILTHLLCTIFKRTYQVIIGVHRKKLYSSIPTTKPPIWDSTCLYDTKKYFVSLYYVIHIKIQ